MSCSKNAVPLLPSSKMSCSKNTVAMDKVCNKCGSVGYAKDIATCFACKRISEHIYCMKKLRRAMPSVWYCEDCNEKSSKRTNKRQVVLLDGIHVPKAAPPVKRSCPFNRRAPNQLNAYRKQHPGTRNPQSTRGGSSRMNAPAVAIPRLSGLSATTSSTIIKTTTLSQATTTIPVFPASRASEAHSQGIKRATNVGVQHDFLNLAVEAGFHKKGNAHDNANPRLGALSAPTNSAIIKTTPISQAAPTITVFPASKASKAHSQGITIATNAVVQPDLSNLAVKSGSHKKRNAHENAIPRLGALSAPTNSAVIKTTPISQAAPTIPIFPASKASEAHSQGITVATNARVQHGLLDLAMEAGSHKKGNAHDNTISETKASGAFCNKETLEKTVGPRSCPSPLNDITVAKSNHAAVLQCQSNAEERKTIAARILEEENRKAIVKKNPLESCRKARSHNNATDSRSYADCEAGSSKLSGNSDGLFDKHGCGNTNYPWKSLLFLDGKHPHHPVPDAYWKGNFNIFDMTSTQSTVYHEIQGIRAHVPGVVSLNVYETVKGLNGKNIGLKLCPRMDIWPKLFELDPPCLSDIGLYFFPSEEQRLKKTFQHFVDMVDKQGLAMRGHLENSELLIFTSAQLTQNPYVMGIAPEVCLWGVFCRIKPEKQTTRDKGKLPFDPPTSATTNTGQNRDSGCSFQFRAGGMTIARTNRPDVPLGPPGFSQAVYRDQAQRGRQIVTSGIVIDSQAVDAPPGFPKPIYRPKRR